MPKREDINKVLIIGSGPIIIGQACEFDYSGTQAVKALRNLGYEIVLVNSNPATIMTDPEIADVTYIEPLNVKRLEQIIAKERPDALLPNLGGQSGLNLCAELAKEGVLEKYNVQVIGVQVDAIERGEDRIEFKKSMDEIGIEMARSEVSYSVDEALSIADRLGYPVVLRPAYTMGGAGGGLVYNKEELKTVCARGLAASLVGQVLVEESILGWEELELEVVRDAKGNMITVCFIENIDPVGVHTGDSFCSAPLLTISEEIQKKLQEQAYKIVDAIEVIGGTNVQFAHDPISGRIIVIEINPRTSRSSALASKATGFPIALVSAMLASGLTLDEIPCGKYGTLDKYIPDGDYVVIKFARWAFEKFKGVEDKLGTQMRAVGEVMSIGKTYKEAFQKAIRSLEKNRYGLGHVDDFDKKSKKELLTMLMTPGSERHFIMYEALRKGASIEEIYNLTKVKTYFIEQMKELVDEEESLIANYSGRVPSGEALKQAKLNGFSDKYLSEILSVPEEDIRSKRIENGIVEAWEGVHVSGTPDSAYYYSTYNAEDKNPVHTDRPKIMILGGGPNRIGQGIEFDYCCVHASLALKKLGFETIIVNCNPETVSTDYDTSDKLYFEPLTLEDVLSIYRKEQPAGVIAQFGGQTPLNLASELEKNGVKILGTSPSVIDLAEDRDLFRAMMDKLEIPMPESGMATTVEEALAIAGNIGYPVMVRPSYVLGGQGMQIAISDGEVEEFMEIINRIAQDHPILVDKYLQGREIEVDAVCDGKDILIPGIMEHIERAGVHSGDSISVYPAVSISGKVKETIAEYTKRLAKELHVIGLINIQFIAVGEEVYVIEVNPRSSRTVPYISKVTGIPIVDLATEVMTGKSIRELGYEPGLQKEAEYVAVKMPVFSFEKIRGAEISLGPEMKSTGECLGISKTFHEALYKAFLGAGVHLPRFRRMIITVKDADKGEAIEIGRRFEKLGYKIYATRSTADALKEAGVKARKVNKIQQESPTVMDLILGHEIDLVIDTPTQGRDKSRDGFLIRRTAIETGVNCLTSLDTARALVTSLEHIGEEEKLTLIDIVSL